MDKLDLQYVYAVTHSLFLSVNSTIRKRKSGLFSSSQNVFMALTCYNKSCLLDYNSALCVKGDYIIEISATERILSVHGNGSITMHFLYLLLIPHSLPPFLPEWSQQAWRMNIYLQLPSLIFLLSL